MILKNKRILITGGTSGIGLELVKQLCSDNEVIVVSRSPSLKDQKDESMAPNTPIKIFQADLGNQIQLEKVADELVREYETIDVLINNAAIQNTPEFLSNNFNYDGIRHEIEVNFTAVCQLTYLMLPLLLKDTPSTILNVNSGLALSPKRTSAVYCATKGALNIFSQSLGYQLAETNIKVQQAFLPLVDTAMTEGRGRGKLHSSDVARSLIEGITRGRTENYIGKAKLLKLMMRIAPSIAKRIMRNS